MIQTGSEGFTHLFLLVKVRVAEVLISGDLGEVLAHFHLLTGTVALGRSLWFRVFRGSSIHSSAFVGSDVCFGPVIADMLRGTRPCFH